MASLLSLWSALQRAALATTLLCIGLPLAQAEGPVAPNAHPAAALIEQATDEMRTEPEATLRDAQAALALLMRTPDPDLEVRARLLLCDYYVENDRKLAEQHIARADALLAAVKRRGLRAGVLQCQGEIYEAAGDNARARALYEEGVQAATATQDDEMLAGVLFSRSYLFGVMGQFASGLGDLRRSEALFDKLSMPQHSLTALNGIAILYNRLGDYAQARDIYQRALKIQRESGLKREEAVTLHNLGRVHEYLGKWNDARANYTEALQISRSLSYARGEAHALRGLAAVANATGNPQAALEILERARQAQRQTPDARLDAQIQLARGVALHKLGRWDDSAAALQEARIVFEQADAMRELEQAHAELAEVYAAQKNWRDAFEHQRAAKATSDRLLRNQLDQRFATLKVEFDTASKEKQNLLLQRENEAKEAALAHERTARSLQAAVIALSGILLVLLTGLAVHQRRTSQRMKTLAMTDELTGVPNRRAVLMRLEPVLRHTPFAACSMLIVDIDHFKSINDHHGHPAGDQALKYVTNALRAQLRGGAFMGRLGGEEFIIALPNTAADAAASAADTFREAVMAIDTTGWLDGRRITVSIGVTTTLSAADTASTLLHRADTALYVAKRAGRNCVRIDLTSVTPSAMAGTTLNEQLAASG